MMHSASIMTLALTATLLYLVQANARAYDLKGDSLVATDSLGRTLPGYKECGPVKPDRYVIVAYEPWFDDNPTSSMGANRSGPYNARKILATTHNNDTPQTPWPSLYSFMYWDEPELGYYLSDDTWVIRKQMEQLMLAGADVLAIDLSNEETYAHNIYALLDMLVQIRKEGGNPPKVVLFLNTSYARRVREMYDTFYKGKPQYDDLWFQWEGKPLILSGKADVPQELQDYFTFRQTWAHMAMDHPTQKDQWSFLELYPQPFGWHDPGVPEQMAVSPCQAANCVNNRSARGRNYHDLVQPPSAWPPLNKGDYEGHNFKEQWDRVLQIDPKFVYVASWNEWLFQRYDDDKPPSESWGPWTRKMRFPGDTGKIVTTDSYNEEFSRDIEPQKGGHGDLYYYQLAGYIRRFKGVRRPETASAPKTIKMKGDFSDWTSVRPEYSSMVGAALHRDHDGWGFVDADPKKPRLHYTNTTGRNEFNVLKVATDATYLYFYAQTREPISSYEDNNWMMLYIDSDCNHTTGWEGYDYLINSPPVSSSMTTVKKNIGGVWKWQNVGKVSFRVLGNKMEIRVPKSLLGYKNKSKLAMNFHWVDNIQKLGDIKEFGINGNSAPARVFNYHYESK